MATVHIFNPENDTALGLDRPSYTAPRAAARLHADGSLLPLWWASDDDFIISPRTEDADLMKQRYVLKGTVTERLTPEQAATVTRCAPWGWSRHARRLLLEAGVPLSALPDDDLLQRLRALSHRRITIEVMQRLHATGHYPILPPIPLEIGDTKLLPPQGRVFVKMPWSSSGRGVRCLDMPATEADAKQLQGMISRQGSIMVEKALDKIADFAMLFHSDGGGVTAKGLSLFNTDAGGVYTGNIVAQEEYLRRRLSALVSIETVDALAADLSAILTEIIAGDYIGWLGVDMMAYRTDNGATAIAPCVEVNMRMTMGVVARLLRENAVIAQQLPALYNVSHGKCGDGEALIPDGESEFSFTLSPL